MPPVVDIPPLLRRFKVWRGFPVHYTVGLKGDGSPDFGNMHEHRRRECFRKNLCHLCGTKLVKPYVFIGGPLCVKYRRFVDGPMHAECADYACKVCPFLSSKDYWANRPVITETPFDIREIDGRLRIQGGYEYADLRPDAMAYCTAERYAVQTNVTPNEYSSLGGPHAVNPFHLGQWVSVVPEFLSVDWDKMPKKE